MHPLYKYFFYQPLNLLQKLWQRTWVMCLYLQKLLVSTVGWNSWTTRFQHSCSMSLKMFAHCHSWSLPQIWSACVSDFPVADFSWRLLSRQLWLNRGGKCCGSSSVLFDQNLPLQTGEKKQPTNPHKFVLQLDKTFN